MTEKETINDGVVETFYKNGQLESRGNYKTGKIYGLYELFHENGQLQEKGNIKDGELIE